MSTEFYWDREKRKFLMRRLGVDVANKKLIFVFQSVEDLIAFLTEDRTKVIYDEYDTAWTVDSIRKEVLKEGAIIVDEDAQEW